MHVEPLESRRLLAGDVSVSLHDGRLAVIGDAADNSLLVEADGDARLRLTGRAGTTVAGRASVVIDRPTRGSTFSMRGGNDRLTFGNVTFAGGVAADGGEGADVIESVGSTFAAADWYGSGGGDTLWLDQSTATGRLRLFGGAGADRTGMRDVRARRGFDVSDAGPNANVGLLRVSASGTGPTSSYVGTSNGRDTLDIRDSDFEALSARLQGGNDRVYVRGTTFKTPSPLNAGGGANRIDRQIITSTDFGDGATDGWLIMYPGRDPALAGTPVTAEEFSVRSRDNDAEFGLREGFFGQNVIPGPSYLLKHDDDSYLYKALTSSNGVQPETSYAVTIEAKVLVSGPSQSGFAASATSVVPDPSKVVVRSETNPGIIALEVNDKSFPYLIAGTPDPFEPDVLISIRETLSYALVRRGIMTQIKTDAGANVYPLFAFGSNEDLGYPGAIYVRSLSVTLTPEF